MRNGFLSALVGLLASIGSVFGQPAEEGPSAAATESHLPAAAAADPNPGDAKQPGPAGPGDPAKGKDQPAAPGAAPATGAPGGGPPGSNGVPLPMGWANDCGGGCGTRVSTILDYLTWFQKNPHALPALVIGGASTTDASGNTVLNTSGTGDLDLAGGTGASLQYGLSSGARLTAVWFWDQCPDYGLEASGFFLAKQSLDLRVDNCPEIARPFCNAADGSAGSLLIAFPGVAVGGVTVTSDTQLWGAELNLLYNLIDDPIVNGYRFNAVAGLRYVDLAEGLLIQSVTSFEPVQRMPQFTSFAGSQIRVSDDFLTKNQFFGVQSGLEAELTLDIGRLIFRTDLAVGVNHEELTIRGSQLRVNPDGSSVASNGGLLALPSNIGRFHREQFVILPEFNLNWLVPLSDSMELSLGYTFIYLDRVIRPGDQIDRTIDLSQVPNFGAGVARNSLNRPAVNFTQGDYYAHGFNVGMLFRW